MKEINWLHLSDLHVGCGCHDWMWPQLKQQLFDDLTKQYSVSGPWQIVFFTGDMTFSGSEFSELEKLLEEVWSHFRLLGCNPKLLVVPGNHDLIRPLPHNSTAKVLQKWSTEQEVQQLFWSSEDNEYRLFVKNIFNNFGEWKKNSKLPFAESHEGIMPGDFSSQIVIDGVQLGVVGLNTSFLHFSNSFEENSLELHQIQINSVSNSNQGEWLKGNDFSVLMTHHDVDWLNTNSKSHYNSSIYPPNSFSVHLCGHRHDSKSIVISEGGSSARRILKAASLFGLEKWGEINNRALGYTAGKFIQDGFKKIIKFWPRTLVEKLAGDYKIEVDVRYNIDNEAVTINLDNHLNIEVLSPEISTALNAGEIQPVESAFKKLQAIPKFSLFKENHHQSVRVRELEKLRGFIENNRCGWVFADWGLGKDGFIRSFISEDIAVKALSDVIVISLPCDEVVSFEDLLDLVEKYCSIPLQELCHLTSDRPLYLIFDNLSPELTTKAGIAKLDDLFQTIMDFSSKSVVIAVNRLPVNGSRFDGVEIKALNIPELRQYITSHPRNTLEDMDVEYVERIHAMSQGIPLYVDYILKLLALSSLDDLYELDVDFSIKSIEDEEKMPHGFKMAIASLQNSADEYLKRGYAMLKVLSLLANGETFVKIKHFHHSKPFYLSNVNTLVDLGLLDAIPINTHAKDIVPKTISSGDQNVSKLLRVPRQVRDYIKSLMSDEDILEIIKLSADFLFGPNWRQGKIKMSGTNFFKTTGAKPIGLGNEHIIAKSLLLYAIKSDDKKMLKQASDLGTSYCELLAEEDRYRDVEVATEELCHFLTDCGELNYLLHLKLILGKAHRMLGKKEQALAIFKELAENESKVFSNVELASIYLNIALIEEKAKNKEAALFAAKKVHQLSDKGSSHYHQATTIIINFKEDVSEKVRLLKQLEVKCRNKKLITVANNICMDLAYESDSIAKTKLLDTVINCESSDYYNRVRAIVSKVNHLATPERLHLISSKDCQNICIAYSYLFSQRFDSLFNQCHEAVWNLLKHDKQFGKILILFMHSSFLWRIRGDHGKESHYISEIKKLPIDSLSINTKEYSYFKARIGNLKIPSNSSSAVS